MSGTMSMTRLSRLAVVRRTRRHRWRRGPTYRAGTGPAPARRTRRPAAGTTGSAGCLATPCPSRERHSMRRPSSSLIPAPCAGTLAFALEIEVQEPDTRPAQELDRFDLAAGGRSTQSREPVACTTKPTSRSRSAAAAPWPSATVRPRCAGSSRCARIWSGGPSATFRPRSSTRTRSASFQTSLGRCVQKSRVLPAAFSRSSSSPNSLRFAHRGCWSARPAAGPAGPTATPRPAPASASCRPTVG